MAKQKDVTVQSVEEVGVEVLAQSIVRLSENVEKLLASGLTMRAICVMVKAETGITHETTSTVLETLPKLKRIYTTIGQSKKR